MSYDGFAIVPVEAVKEGTRLVADGGFTCMRNHEHKTVKRDEDGELYVECRSGKYHGLDGQLDRDGKNYVGFWLEEGSAP